MRQKTSRPSGLCRRHIPRLGTCRATREKTMRERDGKRQGAPRPNQKFIHLQEPHCYQHEVSPGHRNVELFPMEQDTALRGGRETHLSPSPFLLAFVSQGYSGGEPLFSACFALDLNNSKEIVVRS